MAKRVAVIDIGSNSIRMVIYERTSRYAFHLLYESKSKVRLSENAYQNNGELQKVPMQRTFDALHDFLNITKSFKVRKTLCVATSALRDAPNKKEFLSLIASKLKLNIKVINGEREAYLGAIACVNLLPEQENALSIDIGGGSTEFSYIHKNTISQSISLNLGTVRLKELYFDKQDIDGATLYIDEQLKQLNITPNVLIGIGGTFRAISSAIMASIKYPLNKIHAFECSATYFEDYVNSILKADEKKLKQLAIKSNRFDVIKPGALILQRLLIKLNIQKTITSGVGVREGVYLTDLLRNSKDVFPHNYNTSVGYLMDTNIINKNYANNIATLSKRLFDLTYEYMNVEQKFRTELSIASKLYPSGRNIHFYSQNRHTYYLIKSALEYGFTHSQIMLIATLTRYAKNKLPSEKHTLKYKELLPETYTINYLSYLLSISLALLSHKPQNIDFNLKFNDGNIEVGSKNSLYLAKEAVEKITNIESLKIVF